ncbi:phage tail sheath subtilisin-like domain-containing protein [uncultured Endozoicomonas sp.]|uniref:phage tail sheath subtilisin-like domain-containing protein n=1 Tax=uncultured Endozoicomonas sp. TaxID=432652 RepID=UPI002612D169|nr:phage tail sheath subtilisin-like domain-containing protein [uncultured Endozoicomonas sp.]
MSISFNDIPNTVRVPLAYIEIDNTGAISGTPAPQYKAMFFGQMLTTGTAVAGEPVRITSPSQAEQLFGAGSMLATMFRFGKQANDNLETWAIPLAESASGNAAGGSVTVTGTAATGGTIQLMIAGERVPVGVTAGDDASAMAASIAGAISVNPRLPVTASAAAAKVTITCKWKGETGNDIDLRANYYTGEALPDGVGLAIEVMETGSGNPDITDALAGMGDEWYQAIIMPFTDTPNMNALEQEMLERWGPMKQIDNICYCAFRGNHGETGTFGNSRNQFLASCLGTNIAPQPPYIWASVYGMIAAASLSIDPARPLQTLRLPGILPPQVSLRWTNVERELLLHDGIATYSIASGDVVQIEREISFYQENSFGDPDPSYLDITTPATLSYIRYATRTRITQKFPRHKLADDGSRFGPGQAIVTPGIIRGELLALFTELETKGLVENFDKYKASLVVQRNADDRNRLDVLAHPDIVNQLRIFAGKLQFVL